MPWDERDGLVDLRPQHLTGKASGAGKSPGLDLSLLNAKLIAIRYASCAEREIVRYWTLSRDDFDIIFRKRRLQSARLCSAALLSALSGKSAGCG